MLPDLPTELATITPMYDGTPPTGGGLLPVAVVKLEPHTFAGLVDGSVETLSAKPLNDVGTGPPLTLFASDQSLLHQVSVESGVADATVWLPSANAPRAGNANTITFAVADEPR